MFFVAFVTVFNMNFVGVVIIPPPLFKRNIHHRIASGTIKTLVFFRFINILCSILTQ